MEKFVPKHLDEKRKQHFFRWLETCVNSKYEIQNDIITDKADFSEPTASAHAVR